MLGDPVVIRKVNGWLTLFWAANIPPVVALYMLVDNETFQRVILLYVTLISIWANVAGSWSTWQSARVEVKQDENGG